MIAAVLNPAQAETVRHYATIVTIAWFIGVAHEDGTVPVIGVGPDFVWSLLIEADGTAHTSEAPLGEFSTGLEA